MLLPFLPLLFIALVYSIYYYLTRTFNYWKNLNVKGPEPVALFGNIKDSVLRKCPINLISNKIYKDFPDEKVVGVYRMTTPCLMIRDLELIKQVMIKDFDSFMNRGVEFSKEGLGANLFHADDDTWRVLRNRFTPIFSSGKLKNMTYLVVERADVFNKYIDDLVSITSEHEIHNLMKKFTTSSIAACAFGLDIAMDDQIYETLDKIDRLILTNSYIVELDMMYPGLLRKLNLSLFPKEIVNFFFGLVNNVQTERNGKPSERKDFMDLILEMKHAGEVKGTKRNADDTQLTVQLTDSVIAAQAFVFYVAGYETSATTLAYLLYELALNPDIQEKLLAEIDEVLAKHDNQLDYDVIKEFTYLEKVFNETLRMYPILDPLQRSAIRDYQLPGTDVLLKKGQVVLIPVHGIHHDEKYYPDPDKFDPERFSPENIGKRHSCAYLPFGLGPRNCIGMRFAFLQSRVCVVKLLSEFRVEMSENTKTTLEYDGWKPLLHSKNGIPLRIVRRN